MRKKDIQKFTQFRQSFPFEYVALETKDEEIYFKGELVEDSEKKYAEGEQFINIGYNFKNSISKALSNLYPMQFVFRGKKVRSIEGVLQGIKYQDKKTQNLVLNYAGIDAYHTRSANSADFWGENGYLYWQGKPMKRDSQEYQEFLDELYLSVVKNPLYKRILLASGSKYLLHHIGNEDSSQTVLSRFEYEQRLNALRVYIGQQF